LSPSPTISTSLMSTISPGSPDNLSTRSLSLEQTRNEKIVVFKKKRRQNYRRKLGHKQQMTVVRVAEIADADGNKATAEAVKKPATRKPKKADLAANAAATDEE
ncbi:bL21 family ribosomal protein, partial [bacterium]|nr:bL21 family ribosomal protein [bacterium]MDC0655086.1 bL21 family ribosomal protein [bacterium]